MHNFGTNVKEKRAVFLAGALIGTLFFVWIFGVYVLNPFYTDWLLIGIDLPQHYMGWVAYDHSPWHFPVGLMDGVLYPHLISVVYTDSVPLFAFLFKLISPLFAREIQYFGLFGILCYFLQGGFAALFVYAGTGKKWAAVLSSVFCSASLLMMWRMYEHTALAAHWIVIASLYLWLFYEQECTVRKSAFLWSMLSVLAVLTEAYFLPMVWGCMLCSMLGALIGFKEVRRVLIVTVSAAVSTVFFGWIFGMFYGSVPATGEYYGYFAWNLNSFFNSQGYSKIFPAFGLFNFYQFEGLSYLGAGMFLLIAICILYFCIGLKNGKRIFAKKGAPDETSVFELPWYMTLPMLLFLICFILLSMGNVISAFSHGIVLPFPEKLVLLLSVFRSNGRLIWPVYYFILLFTCVCFIRWVKKGHWMTVVLVLALLLQCYDLSGEMEAKNEIFNQKATYENALTDPAWEKVAEEYSHIMYYPNVSSAVYNNPVSYEIQQFAMSHNMTLNIIYFSRNVSAQINEEVAEYFAGAPVTGFDEDTVYVFLAGIPADDCGLYYYFIDNILIATPRALEGVEEFDFDSLLE